MPRKVESFTVKDYGIHWPDQFTGSSCPYGIGDNFQEALNDCLEGIASWGDGIDIEDLEARVRSEYAESGFPTDSVIDEYGDDMPDDCELPYYHVGIRFSLKE